MAEPSTTLEAPAAPSSGYKLANVITSAVLAAAGVGAIASTAGLGLIVGGVPGPGFFPAALGALLVVLAAVQLFLALRGRYEPSEDAHLPDRAGARRLVFTAVLTAAMLILLDLAGYQVTMTGYVFGLLTLVGGRRLLSSALIALVFGIGSYVAFVYGLDLALPNATLPLLSDLGL